MSQVDATPPAPLEIAPLVDMFKALGDESRLRIVGLLAERPRSVEELASHLKLSSSTVSHHLTKLRATGIVSAERDQYYQVYHFRTDRLQELAKTLLQRSPLVPSPSNSPQTEDDLYREEVLSNFLIDGRLVKIPAQRKKREVVLEFLANQFEVERRYPEKEVNAIIQQFHEDFCTLRRELIMGKLMKREHGVYWREAS